MASSDPVLLPLFLPPSEALAGSSPISALEAPTRRALAELSAAAVQRLVLIDSRWRSPRLGVSAPGSPAGRGFASELLRQLAERDVWADHADAAWERAGREYLERWWGAPPDAWLVVGVPPHTPDRAMAVGEAIAAACASGAGNSALVVTGATTRGGHTGSDRSAAFSAALRRLLEAGEGPEILNVGADLWIDGHPDADLGHLFVLLGAAPGHAATYLAEHHAGDAGYAVVVFATSPVAPPAKPVQSAIFPLTLKGGSPRA